MSLRNLLALLAAIFLVTTARADANVRIEASAPPAAIPFKQEKQSSESLARQTVGALLLAGLAAAGIAFGLKRYGRRGESSPRKPRRLQAIETLRLSRQSTLHVIEFNGHELLLAEHGQQVQLLAQLPPATPPDPGATHE
jgi:flagellar biogenesis protein FliO